MDPVTLKRANSLKITKDYKSYIVRQLVGNLIRVKQQSKELQLGSVERHTNYFVFTGLSPMRCCSKLQDAAQLYGAAIVATLAVASTNVMVNMFAGALFESCSDKIKSKPN